MPSSEILHHVTLVRTVGSKEPISSIIRVEKTGELGTTLTATKTHQKKY
jgi:hypothetical protein